MDSFAVSEFLSLLYLFSTPHPLLSPSSIAFGISIGLCAIALIVERNEGLIDRTWVAGVNVTEIIIAQVFTQFFILLVQMALLIVILIFGFKVWCYS